ncbi:MAG: S-formylglutathione hydrolase [Gammaproteobacteria bacterium]|nr:S-formylglutathione hydrolase [Gammaproteobacteria bacterium]
MSQAPELINEARCFGGWQRTYRHASTRCNSTMQFAVYLPPAADQARVPALYWLSGLTCTEENFSVKAGAQRYAAELGIALVIPDTSPRGLGLAGEDDDWDFGSGAGFYLTATEAPWAGHYDMYGYVAEELPALVEATLPLLPGVRSISGHSMGGHGALTIGLKHPERYRSISAFAPICAPMRCAWGRKAFSRYLGKDHARWREYDASWLAEHRPCAHTLLIDQGTADPWLAEQLLPEELERACAASGQPLELRRQLDYEHGYFFVASFIGEHLRFHQAALSEE